MTNKVSIAASVPGAKQATGEIKSLHDAFTRLQKGGAEGFKIGASIAATNAAFSALQDLGAEAVQAAGQIATASLHAYKDQEDSLAKLNTSLRANTALQGDTSAIEKRIKANEALGFTDTDLRNSLALIVPATHDADKALNVQSVAMDLARFKGISLQDATTALVSIEAGRARGLAALGINVKDYSTVEERLQAVEKVSQGQAASYADTLTGQLAVGMAKVNDSGEKLGHTLGNVQTKVMPPLISGVTDLIDKLGGLIPGFNDPIPVLTGLDQWTGKLTDDMGKLGTDFDHTAARAAPFGGSINTLSGDFRNLAGSVRTAASALEDDLFGTAIQKGKEADLRGQLKDLNDQLKGTTGDKRTGLLGQIAAVKGALFDLQLQDAQAAGPDALIKFLDSEKKHTKDLTQAEKDLIAALEDVARKQKILNQISAPGGSGVTYTGSGGDFRPPAPHAAPPTVIRLTQPVKPGTTNINVHVTVTGGVITPGVAYTLAQKLGPYLTKYLVSHNVVPHQAVL